MNFEQQTQEFKQTFQFFIITYTFTWLLWFPIVLYTYHLINISFDVLLIMGSLASFGPMVGAFSLTLKNEGKEGIKNLLKKAIKYKLGWWWIPIIFLIPIGALLGHLLNILFFAGKFPITEFILNPWLIPLFFILTLIIGGPLAEEFGWRGYALPRLQKKWSALNSSLLLGLVWGFWHLPLFFMIGMAHRDYIPIWLFIANAIVFSICMTWLMNNTKGSLIPALLIHTWMNVVFVIFPLMEPKAGGNFMPWLLSLLILVIVLIVVIIKYGPETLSKNEKKMFL